MLKKIILIFGFMTGLVLLVHNVSVYPIDAGYDSFIHLRYAEILTGQWRFPELTETREAYNPPVFYLLSGLTGRLVSSLTGQDFFPAMKVWQYLSLAFVYLLIYFWFQILRPLLPKTKLAHLSFIVLLFALPVFQKTLVMFNLELFSAFLISWGFWYFIVRFQPKPTVLKTIILAGIMILNLLTRMSSLVLLLTLMAGFIGLGLIKKIAWREVIKLLLLFSVIVFLGCGWFYLGRSNQGIYGVGEGGESNISFFKRQPISFFLDVPFKLMMSYPIRQNIYINKLIPIYYDEFWGDYWNYYPQRRFGISIQEVKQDREYTNPARVASLVLQNKVNLLPTLLLIIGFLALLVNATVQSFRKLDSVWLVHSLLLLLTFLTYLGWLVMLIKYPSWKGDGIKASYMLSILPVLIYGMVRFLFGLKTRSIIFIPVVIWLALATGINLWWSWF